MHWGQGDIDITKSHLKGNSRFMLLATLLGYYVQREGCWWVFCRKISSLDYYGIYVSHLYISENLMEPSRSFWDILEDSRRFWKILDHSGRFVYIVVVSN